MEIKCDAAALQARIAAQRIDIMAAHAASDRKDARSPNSGKMPSPKDERIEDYEERLRRRTPIAACTLGA